MQRPRHSASRAAIGAVALLVAIAAPACGDDSGADRVSVRFDTAGGFFDAPFPIATRLRSDGRARVDDFPIGGSTAPLVPDYIAAIDSHNEGFGRNTAVWFPLTGAIDTATLPASPRLEPALSDSVFLVNIEPTSAAFGDVVPVELAFKSAAETFSPANTLVVLPVQGHPLRASTWYAAVITDDVRDEGGERLRPPPAVRALVRGEPEDPAHAEMAAALEPLWQRLEAIGRDRQSIVGVTAFVTGDPSARVRALARAAADRPAAVARDLTPLRTHATFRVFEGVVDLPMFQTGPKPYARPGEGAIEFDDAGAPIEVTTEAVRFSLSVPNAAPGPNGYPLLLYAPGQGGSYLQVVDRGADDTPDDGDGPALHLAERGIAALNIEANLTGPRHPGGNTSGIPFFNIENLVAFLDNHRQAVAEYAVLASLAETLTVPAVGGGTVGFDPDRVFIHGHSTGSVISAVALAVHPSIEAGLLSGAGGSWLYNLVRKQSPAVGDIVTLLLGLQSGDAPDEFDPLINLVAMLWEPIEPMNYAANWADDLRERDAPASVLLVGGVVDTFYLPEMITALAVSARMDALAPVIDPDLVDALAGVGRGAVTGSVSGNAAGGAATLVVAEYDETPGSDGHYVVFEQDPPKHQYSCFFASVAAGAPVVAVGDADGLAPCP